MHFRLLCFGVSQIYGQYLCGLDQNSLALFDSVDDELLGEQLAAVVRAQSERFVLTLGPIYKVR